MSSSNEIQTNAGKISTIPEAKSTLETLSTSTTNNNGNTATPTITTNINNDGNNKEVESNKDGDNTTPDHAARATPESIPTTTNIGGICNRILDFLHSNRGKDSGSSQTKLEKSISNSKEKENRNRGTDSRIKKSEKNLKQIVQYLTELEESLECQRFAPLQRQLQKLQHAFESAKNEQPHSSKTPDRFAEIYKEIMKFKQQISSLQKLSQNLSPSAQSKTSNGSNGHSAVDGLVNVHNSASFMSSSFYEEIKVIYKSLESHNEKRKKFLLSCFAVLPENAVVNRRLLTYWGVGEGFLDVSATDEENMPEKIVERILKEFQEKDLIEPAIKKRGLQVKSYKMHPLVRSAVIMLSEEEKLFAYDSKGNVMANPFKSDRACLLNETEESSSEKNPSSQKGNWQSESQMSRLPVLENLVTLFNVNEPCPDLKLATLLANINPNTPQMNASKQWLSMMKYAKVVCLGSWPDQSANSRIEVESIELLKGLTSKELLFLSLQGIFGISELPSYIGTLSNLLILDLKECHNLEVLPTYITELKNLSYLDVSNCYLLDHMPKGLSALSQLQVFKGFVISTEPQSRNSGTLDDLMGMRKLRKLTITASSEDFPTQNDLYALHELGEKGSLRKLTITWGPAPAGSTQPWATPKTEDQTDQKAATPTVKQGKEPKPEVEQGSTALTMEEPKIKKLPKELVKLDLQCFPMPTFMWLTPGSLPNLEKLYIRGGNVATLDKSKWLMVKTLRLRFLMELEMTWIELKDSFPKLVYLEKFNCPRISLCPCDENGVWMNTDDYIE